MSKVRTHDAYLFSRQYPDTIDQSMVVATFLRLFYPQACTAFSHLTNGSNRVCLLGDSATNEVMMMMVTVPTKTFGGPQGKHQFMLLPGRPEPSWLQMMMTLMMESKTKPYLQWYDMYTAIPFRPYHCFDIYNDADSDDEYLLADQYDFHIMPQMASHPTKTMPDLMDHSLPNLASHMWESWTNSCWSCFPTLLPCKPGSI